MVHTVHDDSPEIGLAERALHVIVVEMQRVVIERGIAKQPNGFAADRECGALDTVAGVETFERRGHGALPYTGRIVQPRPEQITSPRWLKKTLSCTTNSRSRLMNLWSARACRVITSLGRAGMLSLQDCPALTVPGERIQSSAGVQENIKRIWIEGGAIRPP